MSTNLSPQDWYEQVGKHLGADSRDPKITRAITQSLYVELSCHSVDGRIYASLNDRTIPVLQDLIRYRQFRLALWLVEIDQAVNDDNAHKLIVLRESINKATKQLEDAINFFVGFRYELRMAKKWKRENRTDTFPRAWESIEFI